MGRRASGRAGVGASSFTSSRSAADLGASVLEQGGELGLVEGGHRDVASEGQSIAQASGPFVHAARACSVHAPCGARLKSAPRSGVGWEALVGLRCVVGFLQT